MILSAFVATAVNPVTMQYMIAVGASALFVPGLYWISRPQPVDPVEQMANQLNSLTTFPGSKRPMR